MAKQMTESSSTPTHEQIARRAYEIFIERGQPEGKDLDHWLEAESQLRTASQSNRGTQTASAQSSAGAPIRATQMTSPSNGRASSSSGRTQSRTGVRK